MPCPNLCSPGSGRAEATWLPARKNGIPSSEPLCSSAPGTQYVLRKTVADPEGLCHSPLSHPPGAALRQHTLGSTSSQMKRAILGLSGQSSQANPTNTDSTESTNHRARLPFPQARLLSLCPLLIHSFKKYLLNTYHMPDTTLVCEWVWSCASICG